MRGSSLARIYVNSLTIAEPYLSVSHAREHRAILNVWVTPSGVVQRSQYLAPTGDDNLDGAIIKTVQKMDLQQSPLRTFRGRSMFGF